METARPLPPDYLPGTLVEVHLEGLDKPREVAAKTRNPDGTWTAISSDTIGQRARAIALALRERGLSPGERVAIISHTRLEWSLTDWGMIMARVVSVPVYPVLPADQILYILNDAEVTGVFVEDQEQLDKIAAIAGDLPNMRFTVSFEDAEPPPGFQLDHIVLSDLLAHGGGISGELADTYESYAKETAPEDLATLIYTSGTTGNPKGVCLTHANLHSNAVLTPLVFPLLRGEVALSLLPLAHVFERTVGQYIFWRAGITPAYAESTNTVVRDLNEVSPNIMCSVPRLYEKVLEGAETAARSGGTLKSKIFSWARGVGERRADIELAGGRPGLALRLQNALADRLVFSKLRAKTGGKIRMFVSGGAPLSSTVGRFFYAAGLPVLEGYGLTETSPVLTINPLEAPRLGTVGRVVPGTELRIAEDGEILARGPQIMQGYFNRPEDTEEVIDGDGWFHTGDIGEIDADGYLRITDRKKNILITAYGKNIAPAPIEAAIKFHPLIEEAVLLGDQRKFPIAVVVPVMAALRQELQAGEDVTDEALVETPQAQELLDSGVREMCEQFAHFERPREVLVVAGPFTIDGGELTPTMKVRRPVIERRYRDAVDAVYERATMGD